MSKNQAGSTSWLVATTMAVLLLVLVSLSSYHIFNRTWWLPDPINEHGVTYDVQFGHTMLIVGVIFILAQLTLAFVILRYRDRGGKAVYSHGNNTLEYIWTAATAILFIALGIAGEASWAAVHFVGAAPGALQVDVLGKQFAWNFRYPGPDGQFGRTDPALIDDSLGNPFGLDYNDPAAQDDIVAPILGVPVNQEVELTLRTQDVTHSFFVRELRLKQDTTPGMRIPIHFTAEKTGEYELVCAELCGNQHYSMRSWLRVLEPAAFEEFLKSYAPEEEESEEE